ncbi:SHOCT domain-containing protein [Bacillus tropicus]
MFFLQGNATISVADELKKFKELLHMGVITEDGFNAKKKQLLNI